MSVAVDTCCPFDPEQRAVQAKWFCDMFWKRLQKLRVDSSKIRERYQRLHFKRHGRRDDLRVWIGDDRPRLSWFNAWITGRVAPTEAYQICYLALVLKCHPWDLAPWVPYTEIRKHFDPQS